MKLRRFFIYVFGNFRQVAHERPKIRTHCEFTATNHKKVYTTIFDTTKIYHYYDFIENGNSNVNINE